MKHRYPALLSLSLVAIAPTRAQTLDHASTSPQVGETFVVHQSDYMAPGNGGAAQTWNFASLASNGTLATAYISPASTPYAASFPTATLAIDAGEGNYGYFATTSAGMDILGVYSSTLGTAVSYSDPERILSYPCAYNTTWNDPFYSSFNALGFPCVRSGNITGLADGYGTLNLPFGTVSNVLRVRTVEDYSDDLGIAGTIDYDFTTYYYYKPGIHAALLQISDQTTAIAGQAPTTTQGLTYLDGASVGMDEALRNAIGIDLFPNPAHDQVTVTFSSGGGNLFLELIDATGQSVRSERLAGQAMGVGRSDLDVSGLGTGLYLLRITAPNGDQGVQRLVVQ